MVALAERANQLTSDLFERIKGELRPEVDVYDPSLVSELVAPIKASARPRAEQPRRRYLGVILDGLRVKDQSTPRTAPTRREITER